MWVGVALSRGVLRLNGGVSTSPAPQTARQDGLATEEEGGDDGLRRGPPQ